MPINHKILLSTVQAVKPLLVLPKIGGIFVPLPSMNILPYISCMLDLQVSDIHKAIESVRANNIRTLGKEPKIGAHGKLVMFLHPKDCNGTLVELEEL